MTEIQLYKEKQERQGSTSMGQERKPNMYDGLTKSADNTRTYIHDEAGDNWTQEGGTDNETQV